MRYLLVISGVGGKMSSTALNFLPRSFGRGNAGNFAFFRAPQNRTKLKKGLLNSKLRWELRAVGTFREPETLNRGIPCLAGPELTSQFAN